MEKIEAKKVEKVEKAKKLLQIKELPKNFNNEVIVRRQSCIVGLD